MKTLHSVLVASLLICGLAACGTSPIERHYTLESRASVSPVRSKPAYSVMIGPVTVPELVDRPQMVFRVGSNRVLIAEQARWAEPLKSAIGRVIAANLESQLANARVSHHLQTLGGEPDYRVAVDVQSFESMPGKAVEIKARWTVKNSESKQVVSGLSVFRETVVNQDHEALVAAHERTLAQVSQDIAAAIRQATQ